MDALSRADYAIVNLTNVQQYAEGTQGALQQLSLATVGCRQDAGSVKAAKHVGIAMGLALVRLPIPQLSHTN